jgi:hypothetical protein
MAVSIIPCVSSVVVSVKSSTMFASLCLKMMPGGNILASLKTNH